MNKKKIISIMIILIIIIIVTILVLLLNLNKKNEDKIPAETQTVNNNIQAVTSETMFYTIQNNLQKYLTYTNVDVTNRSEENALGGRQTTAEVLGIYSEEDQNEAIMDFLDEEFIKENNINQNNIGNFVEITQNEIKSCQIEEINKKEVENDKEYYLVQANWKTTQKGTEEIINNEGNFIIKIDKTNQTFSIEPVETGDLKNKNNYNPIEKNTRNTYTEVTLNEGEIATRYMQRYTQLMVDNPEKAYEHLQKEYREKRYENVENFKTYVENAKDKILSSNIIQYIANKKEGYVEYVCKDQYENLKIFEVRSVTDYDVKLDTYTIPSEQNEELYQKATEEEKVSLNTEKFIEMINTKDYHTIYNLLDESYKANYFPEEQQLIDYINYYLPNTYNLKKELEDKQEDIYIQHIYLYDKTDETKSLSASFQLMMQIGEGSDFKISLTYRPYQ